MKKKELKAAGIAEALDVPLDALCDVPRTEIVGKSEVVIENFRGILDYNDDSFKINTKSGIIKIEGTDLVIESITDESVCLKGNIIRLEFI